MLLYRFFVVLYRYHRTRDEEKDRIFFSLFANNCNTMLVVNTGSDDQRLEAIPMTQFDHKISVILWAE